MNWIELDDYKKLPDGEWLVKIDDSRNEYHIASVSSKTGDGHKMVIVGSHFSFDRGKLIAYSAFERYTSPNELNKG